MRPLLQRLRRKSWPKSRKGKAIYSVRGSRYFEENKKQGIEPFSDREAPIRGRRDNRKGQWGWEEIKVRYPKGLLDEAYMGTGLARVHGPSARRKGKVAL